MTATSTLQPAIEPWREDLRTLMHQVEKRRPTFFTTLSDNQFFGAAHRLEASLPNLSPGQAAAGLSQLVSLIGLRAPSDASPAVLSDRASARLPLRLYDFTDGIFVTDAFNPYRRAIGKRVTAIGGVPIDDVIDALDPLVARDDLHAPVRTLPLHLVSAAALYALGVMRHRSKTTITVSDARRREQTLRLHTMAAPFYAQWANRRAWGLPARPDAIYLRNPWTPIWHTHLADTGVLYIQPNRALSDAELDHQLNAVRHTVTERHCHSAVVDFRMNAAADARPLSTLLESLCDHPELGDGKRIFTIAGGHRQRALARASSLATGATLVHEAAPGPSPSLDAIRPIVLPNSGIAIHLSHGSWGPVQRPEKTLETRSYRLKSLDFFADNDPALKVVDGCLR